MKKRIPIIILILAAAGAAVWAFRGMGKTPDNRLMISGNIELTEVTIAFKTAGRLIERTVDEGDDVKKGQVIARLDHDQYDYLLHHCTMLLTLPMAWARSIRATL